MSHTTSISTDQLQALVQLAKDGSLRAAAESLLISEQGLRSRLIELERRLGVSLYRKARGPKRSAPLTAEGERLLPRALEILDKSEELVDLFRENVAPKIVNVAASQYLIAYVLLDAIRAFHEAFPEVQVRLSARTELAVESSLRESPQFAFGVAAPYEPSPDFEFRPLFAMTWSFVARPDHALLQRKRLRLEDLQRESIIFYERGSTGRQHVLDAFYERGLAPRVELEATNTDLVVRMVESGLGVGIIPLLSNGAVTRGRAVGVKGLGTQIRPIQSGVLIRRGETLSIHAQRLLEFLTNVAMAHGDISHGQKRHVGKQR